MSGKIKEGEASSQRGPRRYWLNVRDPNRDWAAEVLAFYLDGLPNTEIAKRLGISDNTVASILGRMRRKGVKIPKRMRVDGLRIDVAALNRMVEAAARKDQERTTRG